MNATLTVHRVDLVDGGILLFDHSGSEYRIALYRRRKPNDSGGEVAAGDFDNLVRRELLPRGYHTSWFRVVAIHARLSLGLAHVVEAAKISADPYTVEKYIRATSWGVDLP